MIMLDWITYLCINTCTTNTAVDTHRQSTGLLNITAQIFTKQKIRNSIREIWHLQKESFFWSGEFWVALWRNRGCQSYECELGSDSKQTGLTYNMQDIFMYVWNLYYEICNLCVPALNNVRFWIKKKCNTKKKKIPNRRGLLPEDSLAKGVCVGSGNRQESFAARPERTGGLVAKRSLCLFWEQTGVVRCQTWENGRASW